ncbi:chromosome replication initiation protein [Oceanobacillus piezotolerans]|uniref:Chromosome replication initiation protein n=1 Tax=Oceanobacillus piezotolerans TaxID=2448030 RepID=A0A498DSB7_9BACI|nr:DnaD domain protein [Oceanobacillus piezotolerans]RLL47897.1 chromosome replication initiation protein [Oceanobacillus piezotolerans]
MKFIGQILPVDGYCVLLKQELPIDYAKSLTHLYQPLIGISSVMLYQTLLHETDFDQVDNPQTHHTLMNYLNIPLDEIYKARRKLEAIGLLNTYRNKEDNVTIFTYELNSPFSPSDFFEDAMLSQLLYHQIGDQKFNMLKQQFERKSVNGSGEKITAAFHDVFQTFTPTLEVVKTSNNKDDHLMEDKIDFSWISQMLKQRMIPVGKVLTSDNRKLISQMMTLYDLDHFEIEKSVLWALNEDNILDDEEFKTACHDLFKSKHNQSKIQLTEKQVQPSIKEEIKPATKEEKLINELETISPKQLLEDLSSGNQASEQDMKIIREVMTQQGLPAPVMNVLIHYVLLQSNMKLSKAYMEKIASHWSRAHLRTAKEAMEFAKKETDKFQQKQKAPAYKSYKSAYKRKESKEVVPDWFKERKTSKAPTPSTTVEQTKPIFDLEKEKAELERLLSQKAQNNRF